MKFERKKTGLLTLLAL